jgi:hypothetical protein
MENGADKNPAPEEEPGTDDDHELPDDRGQDGTLPDHVPDPGGIDDELDDPNP